MDSIALFSVSGHSISGSVSIVDHEKTFSDLGSGFDIGFYGMTMYWSYKTTRSSFCLPRRSLPVSVTK